MSHAVLSRWSKRAAIIAGVLWPVVFSVLLVIFGLTGRLEDQSPPTEMVDLETLGLALAFYVPFTIMMLSLAGVSSRYKDQWRVLGKLGCALALIGLAVVPFAGAASLVGTPQGFEPSEMGRLGTLGTVLGTIVLGIGFLLFGIAALRSGTPSRRFGIILIGIGLFQPLILLVSVLRVLAYSLGWIVLGWALPPEDGAEDAEDLHAFEVRERERSLSFEEVVEDPRSRGEL